MCQFVFANIARGIATLGEKVRTHATAMTAYSRASSLVLACSYCLDRDRFPTYAQYEQEN